jgi:hypothetical protein
MQKKLRMTGIEPATFGSLQNSLGKHHVTWNESSCIRVYVTICQPMKVIVSVRVRYETDALTD